jgi:hypothetical protein
MNKVPIVKGLARKIKAFDVLLHIEKLELLVIICSLMSGMLPYLMNVFVILFAINT